VAQPDQEVDVGEAPEQPADESRKVETAELYDRGTAADGRKFAGMPVAKRRQ